MKSSLQTIILFILLLLISCGKSESQLNKEKEATVKQKTEQLKNINTKTISDLSDKYKSISGWDTLKYFTYVFQEMFIDEGNPISFVGNLKDITKSDSNYILIVYNSQWLSDRNFIAQISIDSEKFIALKKQLQSNNHSHNGCFIFKVSKIFSASPQIISEPESDGEELSSYLDYDFDETLLIFKGDLIDFYLNEIIEKNYE